MAIAGPLTTRQIRRYDEQGYVVVPDVFCDAEVDEMRRAFEALSRRAKGLHNTQMVEGSQFVVTDEIIHRVVWCGACEPVLLSYGGDRRLVSMASQLLECSPLHQLINQAHFKHPGDGVSFAWHQDSRHRRYGTDLWRDVGVRGSFIETATAIDPMTDDNGPLRFIAGSHLNGHIEPDPKTNELPPQAIDAKPATTLTMDPGSVVLFGPYTIHSSGPNQSQIARRLFLNGYAHPDANRRDYPGDGSGRELRVGPHPS